VATGQEITTIRSNEGFWALGALGALSSVAFSRDGRTIIVTSEHRTRLLEANSGKEIAMPGGSPAALSPDGYTAVTYSHDNTARLWEVATGKEIGVLRGHEGYVESVAFSPDGRTVVTGSHDKTARVWEVASGREVAVLRDHESSVAFVGFSPKGDKVVTSSSSPSFGTVARLWDAASGREIGLVPQGRCDTRRFQPRWRYRYHGRLIGQNRGALGSGDL
jgi:WD40 repeat protein